MKTTRRFGTSLVENNNHKQRISLAAVMADAKPIRRRLLVKKQQLFNIAAPAASAFNGSA